MHKVKVVVFDLDGTIWDHLDVSSLKLPFSLINKDIAEDANGVKIKLFPGVRKALNQLAKMGKIVSIASWNRPEPALQLLSLFDIIHYFKYPKIHPHPKKYEMILELL